MSKSKNGKDKSGCKESGYLARLPSTSGRHGGTDMATKSFYNNFWLSDGQIVTLGFYTRCGNSIIRTNYK
jgi:hypothetical protein